MANQTKAESGYIVNVPLDSVLTADYNPEGRDSKDNRHVVQLAASIDDVGQIAPAIAMRHRGDKYRLIDGHRRLAALKLLRAKDQSYSHITVYVPAKGGVTACPIKAYAEANERVRPHNPAEQLKTWVRNPLAVTPNRATHYANIQSAIGRSNIELMADHGVSPSAYAWALRVSRYCGWGKEAAQVIRCLQWLILTKSSRDARTGVEGEYTPEEFHEAIAAGSRLKARPR